ncbi:ABC transporter substrate-binding protein [Oscillospiraceae bacterium PP1C4]
MKKILAGLLAGCMLFSMTACGGTKETSSTPAADAPAAEASAAEAPAAEAAKPEKIVIGGIQDLSGGSSVSGVAMNRGAELAIADINALGGINGVPVEYICYDVKGDPQEAINAYNRLCDQDKASVVIGPPISNIGLALTETAAQKKVPIVGAFIDSRVTKKEDGKPQDYMFLVQPTNEQSGIIQASYLVDVLGKKKVAIFYDQTNAFGVSQVKAFKEYVTSAGGEIVSEQIFKSGDVDFKTQLTKIKESGAEGIFAPNYPKDNTLYCNQMKQLGMDNLITMGGLEFAPPFLTTLPDPTIVNNVYFALNCAFDEPQLQDLNKAYIDKYDDADTVDDISVKVYLAYDAVMLAAEGIKNANMSTSGEDIKAGLEAIEFLECKSGNIGFSPETHQPKGLSMVMYKITDGVNENLGRYVPEILK